MASMSSRPLCAELTHWARVMHICVNKLTIIGSDYGLAPGRRKAIIWSNAGILLIGPLGTNFREILNIFIKKMHLKMSSGQWRPSCLGLNVLDHKECTSGKKLIQKHILCLNGIAGVSESDPLYKQVVCTTKMVLVCSL